MDIQRSDHYSQVGFFEEVKVGAAMPANVNRVLAIVPKSAGPTGMRIHEVNLILTDTVHQFTTANYWRISLRKISPTTIDTLGDTYNNFPPTANGELSVGDRIQIYQDDDGVVLGQNDFLQMLATRTSGATPGFGAHLVEIIWRPA